MANKTDRSAPLRIFCVEDNPLIVFHIEHLIEDAGYVFLGSAGSLGELKADQSKSMARWSISILLMDALAQRRRRG